MSNFIVPKPGIVASTSRNSSDGTEAIFNASHIFVRN